jgi:hypothetical protein
MEPDLGCLSAWCWCPPGDRTSSRWLHFSPAHPPDHTKSASTSLVDFSLILSLPSWPLKPVKP